MSQERQLTELQFREKYARWNEEEGRRETYEEAVDRAVKYLDKTAKGALSRFGYDARIRQAMLKQDVMPSMRLLNQAGKAADANNIGIYNCAYTPISRVSDFRDAVIILGHGTGLGYSVESRYIDRFPTVLEPTLTSELHVIEDSIEGWGKAIEILISMRFSGVTAVFDFSRIRPAGAPLLTRGGVASGPQPLKDSMIKIGNIFDGAIGRKLKPIEVHDIMCHIADAIVSGGVRRSAMIALFDFDDEDMWFAKTGDWWTVNPARAMANNSVVVEEELLEREWKLFVERMHASGAGEPGVFSRYAAELNNPARREKHMEFGTNPCGEIILRPRQFCNLSIVVGRPGDDFTTLAEKIELATIIGTVQSKMDQFKGISPDYYENAVNERLLGVDITGVYDSEVLTNVTEEELEVLRAFAINVNAVWSKILRINKSAAVTCVKPSGNSSVLLNTSSGIHKRAYEYYIRRIRMNYKSPVAQFLMDSGVPVQPENGQTWDNPTTVVFSFPMYSGSEASTGTDDTAISQLDHWLKWKCGWTEHNPSVTISYTKDEVDEIAEWLWLNQEWVGGLSFLPRNGYTYEQTPKEQISRGEYEKLNSQFPKINWHNLSKYDIDPSLITSSQEFACLAGSCEI